MRQNLTSFLRHTATLAASFTLAATPSIAQTTPAPAVEEIYASSFQDKVLSDRLPVLVEFSASWCGWCRLQKPLLLKTPASAAGGLKIYSLDVEKNAVLAKKYGVDGVPVLAIFYGGQMVSRQTGYLNARELAAWVGKTVHIEYRTPKMPRP